MSRRHLKKLTIVKRYHSGYTDRGLTLNKYNCFHANVTQTKPNGCWMLPNQLLHLVPFARDSKETNLSVRFLLQKEDKENGKETFDHLRFETIDAQAGLVKTICAFSDTCP